MNSEMTSSNMVSMGQSDTLRSMGGQAMVSFQGFVIFLFSFFFLILSHFCSLEITGVCQMFWI